MKTGSRRWRWWLAALAALMTLCWWLLSDEPTIVEAPQVGHVAPPAPDAGTRETFGPLPVIDAPSARAERPARTKTASCSFTRPRDLPWPDDDSESASDDPFKLACATESAACESALDIDEAGPLHLFLLLGRDGGHTQVTGMDSDEAFWSEFERCMVRGMKKYAFEDSSLPFDVCPLAQLSKRRSLCDPLGRAIFECIAPDATATSITATTTVSLVERRLSFSPPTIETSGSIGMATERCIQRAFQSSAIEATPEQAARFVPFRQSVTFTLTADEPERKDETPKRVDPRDMNLRFVIAEGLAERPPASFEEQQEATRLADEAEAALASNDVETARSSSERCLKQNREELRCHRALAVSYLPDWGGDSDAVLAWLSFVKRAPAWDPDVLRVRDALTAAGWVDPPFP